uniref:Uncharacterized protein n=1 Tax=Panagrolaimus sp. ES5 TaxID=591445 RepID=A0AC34G0Z4_9BILA
SNPLLFEVRKMIIDMISKIGLQALGEFYFNDNQTSEEFLKALNNGEDLKPFIVENDLKVHCYDEENILSSEEFDKLENSEVNQLMLAFFKVIHGVRQKFIKAPFTLTEKQRNNVTIIPTRAFVLWQQAIPECQSLSALALFITSFDSSVQWTSIKNTQKCPVCRKKTQAEDSVICDHCGNQYHMQCTPDEIESRVAWLCKACNRKVAPPKKRKPPSRYQEELDEEEEKKAPSLIEENNSDEEADEEDEEEVTEEDLEKIVKFCCYMCTKRDGGMLTIYRCNACAGCWREHNCGICSSCCADPKKKCIKRRCILEKNDPYADIAPVKLERKSSVSSKENTPVKTKRPYKKRGRKPKAEGAKFAKLSSSLSNYGRSPNASRKAKEALEGSRPYYVETESSESSIEEPPKLTSVLTSKEDTTAVKTTRPYKKRGRKPKVVPVLSPAVSVKQIRKCSGCEKNARKNSEFCSNKCWFKKETGHITATKLVLDSHLRSGKQSSLPLAKNKK